MKYKLPELLIDLHSNNKIKRSHAEKKWTENISEYDSQFKRVKRRLPKEFLSVYEECDGFHDWYIDSIQHVNSENHIKDKLILAVSHLNDSYDLTFFKVEQVHIDIKKSGGFALYDKDEYLYDEWEIISKQKLQFELLTLSFSSIKFVFRDIMAYRTSLCKIHSSVD